MPISSRATLPKSGKKGPRKSSSLPAETVEYLKAWMMSPEHIAHPYPTEPEKAQIMADTGIELKQLTNWFVNNRKRYWKPRVEARLQQQARAAAAAAQAHAAAVAVATASVHTTNPVSPDQGFKPTLTIPPPTGNGFVTFDLASSPVASPTKRRASSLSYSHHPLVATDMARVVADSYRDEQRVVSETSSSASTASSEEGNVSDASEYEQPVRTIKTVPSAQEEEVYSSQQTTGESSSSVSLASTSAYVSLCSGEEDVVRPVKKRKTTLKRVVSEASLAETPRKKYRRASIELWRESCQQASCAYNDDALPSLEEATQLFGYNSSQ